MVAGLVSRILGLAREMSIAHLYGNSDAADAFWAAFTGPDMLYIIVAGGALSAAFLPLFLETREKEGEEAGWQLVGALMGTLGAIVALLSLGIMLAAPLVVHALVPKWETGSDKYQMCVLFTRLIAVQPLLLAISALTTSIYNSFRQFIVPAVAWQLYNIAILAATWLGYWYLGKERGLQAAAIGVVAGAALMVAVQIPGLIRAGMHWRVHFAPQAPKVKIYFARFGTVVLGTALPYAVLFWLPSVFGSYFPGSVTTLRYSMRLFFLPFSLFSVSIATAAFPALSAEALKGGAHDFAGVFSRSKRGIALLIIPSAVGLAILAVPINIALWQGGEFGAGAALATAFALAWYTVALITLSLNQLVWRGFYAIKDVWTPATTAGLYLAVTAGLTLLFVRTPMKYGALAAATSVGGVFVYAYALTLLRRRIGRLGGRAILATALRSLVAAAAMGIAVYFTANALCGHYGVPMTQFGVIAPDPRAELAPVSRMGAVIVVAASIAVGAAVYAMALWLIGAEEVRLIRHAIGRRK